MKKDELSLETLDKDLRTAVEACQEKKAAEILVLDLRGLASFTDYFLICSGASNRQLKAIADRFDAQLSQTAWLAGDEYSLADIAMAPMMDRLEYLAMAGLWEGRPAVSDWITRLKARTGYQQGIPPMEHRFKGPLTASA